MSNNIINHRLLVQSRIEKSFQSNGLSMKDVKNTEDIFKSVTPDFLGNEKMVDLVPLSKAEQVEALSDGEFEKAHNDGDIHPNHPDWVWVSSANKGRGDWRKINGRAHKAHGEYRDKFNATFKDADEKILQKIVSGEIQGTAHDKQLAKKMLEDRKSGKVKTSEQEYDDASFSDKVAINLKNENPKYSDKSKITFEDNNNGKYKIMYDGEYTKLLISKDKVDEADAKKAGFIKDKSDKDNNSTKKATTRDNLVEALKIPSKIFDEDTRKNDYGKWYEAVTAYEQKGASAIGSAIGKTFKKDFNGYLSTRLGEYRSKDGGTAVTIKVDYDTGLRTHINHSQVQMVSRDVRGGLRLLIEFPYDNTTKSLNLSEMNEKELNNLVSALKKIDSFKIADTSKIHGSTISEKTENYVKSVLSKLTNKESDKKEPAIKYSEMTAAQANKTLVGKTIKIGDKTAKIMNAFKSSVPGSKQVYLEVVDGDDYLGKYMQISLDAVDSGKTKYDNKYFGTKGQKIEISDEKPDKKEVTKESFKEFLDYMQKNIAKKDSDEFLNKEYMFLFTVPKKYRSSAGNVHNRVAATIKKLSDANNW